MEKLFLHKWKSRSGDLTFKVFLSLTQTEPYYICKHLLGVECREETRERTIYRK